MSQHHNQDPVDMMSMVDPYFYDRLCQYVGSNVAIQTPRGTLQGKLAQVMPDHIALRIDGADFYIRINEITWFTRAVEPSKR